ncbi:MAG: sodium-dependent transporter [Pseudomonadales bacterium]
MQENRGRFSSRLGFILAAAGSAVGLGNIWGFPTQAASNGGAAFLLVYLVLAFCLAYPVLMAELVIGRHTRGNPIHALRTIASGGASRGLGTLVGGVGIVCAGLILSFYSIVGGWMLAHFLAAITGLVGLSTATDFLVGFTTPRNILFAVLFMFLTIRIVASGIESGIERWSTRLMPALIAMLVLLTLYVLTLPGAMDGLREYLVPNFEEALTPKLIISALGSAFFSLSLGVGTMLIYGSYVSEKESLPSLGAQVTLIDISIAVMAGFLILPAMYVALHNGVEIFAANGALISEDTLIFTVLPALFDSMGTAGAIVGLAFFLLMSIAALTSSISMLEVPVAAVVEQTSIKRTKAAYLTGSIIFAVSVVIIFNFADLFGAVIALTTRYTQPLLGMMFCLYVGWIWQRNGVLEELKKGAPDVANGIFWKIWPVYVKFFCPVIVLMIFVQAL